MCKIRIQAAGECSVCNKPVAINSERPGNIAALCSFNATLGTRCRGTSVAVIKIIPDKHFANGQLVHKPMPKRQPA